MNMEQGKPWQENVRLTKHCPQSGKMKDYQTLTFREISSVMEEVSTDLNTDFVHRKAQHKEFGILENRILQKGFFGIQEFRTNLNGSFRIAFDEAHMLQNMNICAVLDGKLSIDLKESSFSASLNGLEHHGVYAHETEYDLCIDKDVHVVHITVDREYYAGLLHDNERAVAGIKEKLLKKDLMWSGTGGVNLAMKRAINDLLHNPLDGNLKSLYIEAKILELVALQLNDLNQPVKMQTTRVKDTDVFHDIRSYLNDHFREDLSLRMLSRMFGVNEFKLKKGFKSQFNTTVFDYIHELKMTYAKTLLLDEKMFVNEVAGTIGYKNPNHFSTAFKRKFGVSPTAMK